MRTTEMQGKVCLVTGANSGIGKETAVALAALGADVVMTSRDRAKGESALADARARSGSERIVLMLADFASMRSVREFAAEFIAGHPRLDVLVNNAGAVNMGRSVTADGFETTFGVNHLGYFLVTDLLLETLKASAPARIVNVSSDAHVGARMNFDDLQSERYSGMRAYGQSKLANVLFTYELARRLEGTGVTVNALHPGVVMTGFGRNNAGPFGFLFAAFHTLGRPFLLTAAQGAETSVHLASSPEVEGVTGRYFVRKRATASSPASRDDEAALRLWQISEELTKAGAPAAAAAV